MTAKAEPVDWNSIEQLCDFYLDARPSAAILHILKPLAGQRSEVRDFAQRVLRLIGTAQLGSRNISPMAAFAIGMSAGILPGAWGGKVPPITSAGRHKIIDEYITANRWQRFEPGTVMIELGCGFPPTTAIETAQRFPEWQIVGADPFFDPYILYDRNQSYACLNGAGELRYFQLLPTASIKTMEDFLLLRQRVPDLFAQLKAKLAADNGEICSVEAEGSRLVRWPLRQWESANLKFIQAGVGSDELPKANVIRCFNVLMYFEKHFLRQFETWAVTKLTEGGVTIVGGNAPNGSEGYFSVYQKVEDNLIEKEFAFSVDILRPLGIMPWFSLHDESAASNLRLARLVRRLRSDAEFCAGFDAAMDQLLKDCGLLVRDANGCLASPPVPIPFDKIVQLMAAIGPQLDAAGFTERAAEACGKQGIRAWRNEVGYLAVDPATLALD